jgi:hypothetical protein
MPGAVDAAKPIGKAFADGFLGAAKQVAAGVAAGGEGVTNDMREADHRSKQKRDQAFNRAFSQLSPRALSGAAARDQAKANRGAKLMDPQLKTANAALKAAEVANDWLQKLSEILEDKLQGVEMATR